MDKKIFIVGAGTGNKEMLTAMAQRVIAECEEIYTTSRMALELSALRNDIITCSFMEMADLISKSKAKVICALVSGDTGFFSAAKSLNTKFAENAEVEIVCGISSLQYLCAKLGCGYEDLKLISLHGRDGNILGSVAYNKKVFVLTGGNRKAHDICKELVDNGMGAVMVTVGENLSMTNERIVKATAQELSFYTFDDLAVMLIENDQCANPNLPLCDSDFIRSNVPMTKQEIRWLSLANLAIMPDDIIYDIGAGTGSVSIEAARKANNGMVYAIEKEADAALLIHQNRQKLDAYNLVIIEGTAPEMLVGLPKPDKAFIGGSSGNLKEIVNCLLAKNPQIHIVLNAVTLETLAEATSLFKQMSFQTEISCINVSKAKHIGSYNLMTAANPVYIIRAHKNI